MPEKILYDCVRELLSSKSRSLSVNYSSADNTSCSQKTPQERQDYESDALAADMECLCQFLTTVGQHMDTPKAKNLMDQFFDRLTRILERSKPREGAACVPLASRIRFMIDDLIDLRENRWVPRRAGQRGEVNKPRYLRDIRYEVSFESGTMLAPTRSERVGNQRDTPGSGGYVPPALAKAKAGPGVDPAMWMELNRMGEALCRRNNAFDLVTNSLSGNSNNETKSNTAKNSGPRYQPRNKNGHQQDEQNGNNNYHRPKPNHNKLDEGSWTRGGGQNLSSRGVTRKGANDGFFANQPGPVESHEAGKTLSAVIGVNPEVFNSSFEPSYLKHASTPEGAVASHHPQESAEMRQFSLKNATISNASSLASIDSPAVEPEYKKNARALVAVLLENSSKNPPGGMSKLIAGLQEIVPLTQLNQDLLGQLFLIFTGDQCGLQSSNRTACVYLWGSVLTRARQESFLAPAVEMESQLVGAWQQLARNVLPAQKNLSKSNLALHLGVLIWCGHLQVEAVAAELVSGRFHPLFLLILQQLDSLVQLAEESASGENRAPLIVPGSAMNPSGAHRNPRQLLQEMVKNSHIKIHTLMPDGSQTPDRLSRILEDRALLYVVPELSHFADYQKLVSGTTDGDGQYSLDCLIDFLTSNKIDLDSVCVIHCLVTCVLDQALGIKEGAGSEAWNAFWTATRQLAKHVFMGQETRQSEVLDSVAIYAKDRSLAAEQLKEIVKGLVANGFVTSALLVRWLTGSKSLPQIDLDWVDQECIGLADELNTLSFT